MMNGLLLLLVIGLAYYLATGGEVNAMLVVIVLAAVFLITRVEGFSKSGLSMSDVECDRLTAVYYRPTCPECQGNANKICGTCRRNTVEPRRGNYFTLDGLLV